MAKRLLELIPSGLFGDKAILTSLTGREEISQLYEFSLTIASPKDKLKPEEIIGQPLAVRIDRGDEEPRFVHGYISHMWAGDYSQTKDDQSAPSRAYRVRLVPWLWFMTRAARSFVYLPEKLEKSIQDVIDKLIERVQSYGHVKPSIESGAASILKSRKVEHCVQYRETDFNFLARTLEQYGVYYYFKHEESQHTLVLSDQPSYPEAMDSKVEYHPGIGGEVRVDTISSWEHAYEFVSGKYEQTEYDFKHPSSNLKVSAAQHSSIPLTNNSGYELFDYPGDYIKRDDGDKEAIRRMEEEESRFNMVQGSSFCKSFSPGYTFKLTKHHSCKDEEGKSYLLTSISHSAGQPGPFSGHGSEMYYANQFTCIPKESQYRPRRTTLRPTLPSVQTAVVVGPPGEEIYTDEFGRVKVQFYWDREGKRDENTSCWIRVSQYWAGQGWGAMHIPHIGHEVIVAFLEGDLDRPLVIGRAYNQEQNVPMPLPDEKTRSVLRDYGGNETVMEGAQGKQFIHTQQTCGNEFLMDGVTGQEKIELRDKYGNEIVLDAVKGTIRIYSPTHESGIVLGRSIENFTLSDLRVDVQGNRQIDIGLDSVLVVEGSNHQTIVGLTSKLIGGMKHETVVGMEAKFNAGAKFEAIIGLSLKVTKGKHFRSGQDDKVEVRKALLEKATATKIAVDQTIESGAKKISSLADKIEMHGEKAISAIANAIDFQAQKAKLAFDMFAADAKKFNFKAPKTDIGSGALKVTGSGGKSPKSATKRKSSKASTPENKAKKAARKAQKAARRVNRGK